MGFKFLTSLLLLFLLVQVKSQDEEENDGEDGDEGDDDDEEDEGDDDEGDEDDDDEGDEGDDDEGDEDDDDNDDEGDNGEKKDDDEDLKNADDETLFKEFQKRYERNYENEEEYRKRFETFKENLKEIKELNKNSNAKFEINQFADMNRKEFLSNHTGLMMPSGLSALSLRSTLLSATDIPQASLPVNFDWRQYGKVTRVKNQGGCGSCWTFSAVGNIEGVYAVKYNYLPELSEQQLLDCDRRNLGCGGGWPLWAMNYVKENAGLNYEYYYQYTGRQEQCRFNRNNPYVQVSGGVSLPKDEVQMQQYIYSYGPISVAINVGPWASYKSGILRFNERDCAHNIFNHAVVIVGWGQSGNTPYWIIKNSWGPGWGEQGYARLYRGENFCGIREVAVSATL